MFHRDNDADGTHGDYEFKAMVYDSDGIIDESTTETFTLDGKPPSVSFNTGGYVKSYPFIEVEISDSYTDITDLSASVDNDADIEDSPDFDSCSASDDACTVEYEIDTSSLDSGDDFTLEIEATDEVGNTGTNDKTFTFDNSYDGDTNPSLDWDSYLKDGIILMDGDEDLTVEYNDDEERPNEVTCYDGSDRIDRDSRSSSGDGVYEFDCRFDDDDYAGTEVELNIEACDEAGNCDEYEAGNFAFDAVPPSFVNNPSTVVGTFNDDFTVDFLGVDDVSGLTELEYFFDADTNKGDGYSVEIDDSDEEFTVDTSDLDEGQHTLYVRLKDGAERWSSTKSLNFEYDPDANPELSLNAPDSLAVTAGESTEFSVTAENTGNLLISGAELLAEGEGINGTEEIDELYPNEDTEFNFEVSPDEEAIGSYELTVSSENPSVSKSIDLRVEANEKQQGEIESDLSDYQSKLESLRSNVSGLKENGISEDLSNQLDSDYSTFEQEVEDAQSAVNDGEYYKAQSILEDIDSTYDTATSTYNEVEQTYQEGQRKKMIMFAVVGFFGIFALAGAFFWRSEEYEFNYERIIDSDISVASIDGFDLEGLKSRISAILEREEEAEEFEWQGFS